jgi:hypothetical protein
MSDEDEDGDSKPKTAAAYIDMLAPNHMRTSCSDSNPDYNAQYSAEDHGGCPRCTMMALARKARADIKKEKAKHAFVLPAEDVKKIARWARALRTLALTIGGKRRLMCEQASELMFEIINPENH